MLTEDQRKELEALGPETVRFKLLHGGSGRGADVPGFAKGALAVQILPGPAGCVALLGPRM